MESPDKLRTEDAPPHARRGTKSPLGLMLGIMNMMGYDPATVMDIASSEPEDMPDKMARHECERRGMDFDENVRIVARDPYEEKL